MPARLTLLAGLVCLTALACGGGSPRREVLTHIATEVAIPRFEQLDRDAAALASEAAALCAAPSADRVEGARDAWRTMRGTWIGSSAVWFGPVMDRRSRSLIDWTEVDTERIEATIAERTSVTTSDVSEFFAATQRGLGSAEYLLFDGTTEEIATALGDSVRCQYLLATLDVVAAESSAIIEDWTTTTEDGDAYRDRLTAEAAVSIDVGAAINEVGETQVFLLRMLADMQLGAALGLMDPEPDPLAIPGGAAGNERADLLAQVRGIQAVYLGTDGGGLTRLLADRSADADLRIRAAFDAALEAIEATPDDLRAAVADQTAEALAAHQSLESLQIAWNTDVVSLLGITVGFSDADGDTG